MIRTVILVTFSVLIFSAIQIGNNYYFNEKPDIIMDLGIDQKKANEKFITAQLLSSSLNRVYQIFIQNLTFNNKRKSEKNDSIDFLNYLTNVLNKLEIKILSIKPKSSEKRGKNLYNPYEIDIKSSYEKFGKFITQLEQTTRLIEIEEITLNNGLERIRSTNRGEQLQTQDYTLIISTISLNKVGGIKKKMQNLISNELDKDPSIAMRLKAALIDVGYDARIVEVALDNNRLYIIYIGYFEDMKAAQSHSEKLKKHMGIDNTIKSI